MGRLNHVACIFLPMRHFMGRLYCALYRAKARSGWTTLSTNELLDQTSTLHLEFLQYAKQVVSLNNVSFQQPTHIYRSDASEFGIGGYNFISGQAWHWEIPTHLVLHASINSLEFMASLITIWVDVISGRILPEDCLLSQTDSSTSAGWLRKSNFANDLKEDIQLATAKRLATLIINSKCCFYSQWFPGNDNNISDSLSRDFHWSDSHLTGLLSTAFPHQVPFGLEMLPLPTEISSWVTSQLLLLLQTMPWSKEPTRSSFALGVGTETILCPSGSVMTSSWNPLTGAKYLRSSVHLLSPPEKVDLVLSLPDFSKLSQSEPPWIVWHKHTSWLSDQTQDWMLMASLPSIYSDNFGDIQHLTQENNFR
jgi:hypothetical protein